MMFFNFLSYICPATFNLFIFLFFEFFFIFKILIDIIN